MAYATAVDLAAWTGQAAPPDADRLLERASTLVDSRITTWYPADETGLPTELTVSDALSDAVCAQVEYWQTGGGEQDDILGPAASSDVGALSITESWSDRLAPRTFDRLRLAGLINAAVGTVV